MRWLLLGLVPFLFCALVSAALFVLALLGVRHLSEGNGVAWRWPFERRAHTRQCRLEGPVGSMTRAKADAATSETERVRRIYGKLAPRFDRKIRFWERVLFAGGREWVCSQARGDVLEIGVGTGRNLAYYPEDTRLTGIEISPQMLEIARDRTKQLGREADLRLGDAQALEFAAESFDTVVGTLVLCSIPDDRKAVAEVKRVLRPDGVLLLLEHVRSPNPIVRSGQRLLEPIASRFEGDHLLREPIEHLRAEGFEIEELERSKWGIVERVRAREPV